jgi:hypothetical protein
VLKLGGTGTGRNYRRCQSARKASGLRPASSWQRRVPPPRVKCGHLSPIKGRGAQARRRGRGVLKHPRSPAGAGGRTALAVGAGRADKPCLTAERQRCEKRGVILAAVCGARCLSRERHSQPATNRPTRASPQSALALGLSPALPAPSPLKNHTPRMACRAAPSCVAAPALGGRLACAARRPPSGRVGRQRPWRRRRQAPGGLRRARAVQQRPAAAPAHGRGRAGEVCLAGRGAGAALQGAGAGAGVLGPGVEVGDSCDGCVDRARADVRAHVARACEQSRYGGWQRGLRRAWGGRQVGRARWAAPRCGLQSRRPAGQWRGDGQAAARAARGARAVQADAAQHRFRRCTLCLERRRTYGRAPVPIRAVGSRAACKAGLAPVGVPQPWRPARQGVREREQQGLFRPTMKPLPRSAA